MRILFFLVMAFALVGCGSTAPVQPTEPPAATPIVPVPTVEVTQPAPTQGQAEEPAAPAGPALELVAIPASFNGEVFTDMSASTGIFSLRCEPAEITFDVNTTNASITQVDMYFRLRDKQTTEFPPNWSWGRTLNTDGSGHFWTTVKGEDIPVDMRKAQSWYDVQFIGLNRQREVVGRSERITYLFSYTIECPPASAQGQAQEGPAPAAPAAELVAIPASFNGDVFTDMSASTGIFSLNCEPKEITFDVNVTDASITQVDMYYRLRDKQADEIPPDFKWGRTLDTDGSTHFWTTVKGDDIPVDLRKPQNWYEVQFIGLNKQREVVGRGERILELLTYTVDCP